MMIGNERETDQKIKHINTSQAVCEIWIGVEKSRDG